MAVGHCAHSVHRPANRRLFASDIRLAEAKGMGTRRPPMRGRRHDSIALPGGRRVHDPDPPGTRVAAASQADTGGSMADNLKQTGKQDNTRINIEQEHEVKYLAEKF